MAKGQVRSNKETRKPKAKKDTAAPPVGLLKSGASAAPPKKKG